MSLTTSTGTALKPVVRDLIDIRKAAQYALRVIDGGRSNSREPLDEGSSGQVFRGRAIVKGYDRDVVIKYGRFAGDSPKSPRDKITRLLREVLAWQYLHHPNVAEFYGLDFTETNVDLIQGLENLNRDPDRQLRLPGLVSPYLEHSVLEYVLGHPRLRENCVLGLARGLTYIHQNLIVHGDVRPENIRVDRYGVVKVIDFGFSRLQDCRGFTTDAYADLPPRFSAPEIIFPPPGQRVRSTIKSDVYSFGMCMLLILAHPDSPQNSEPFNHKPAPASLLLYISREKGWPRRESYSTHFPDALWRLMEECWRYESDERPKMRYVLDKLEA